MEYLSFKDAVATVSPSSTTMRIASVRSLYSKASAMAQGGRAVLDGRRRFAARSPRMKPTNLVKVSNFNQQKIIGQGPLNGV